MPNACHDILRGMILYFNNLIRDSHYHTMPPIYPEGICRTSYNCRYEQHLQAIHTIVRSSDDPTPLILMQECVNEEIESSLVIARTRNYKKAVGSWIEHSSDRAKSVHSVRGRPLFVRITSSPCFQPPCPIEFLFRQIRLAHSISPRICTCM